MEIASYFTSLAGGPFVGGGLSAYLEAFMIKAKVGDVKRAFVSFEDYYFLYSS